ncbi:MAG: TlpA family protein disulfide reductase [Bryobacterales bacterium]|nr:TlpA family protein disulfide reductase [Bryobacterales bacterium]
MNSVKTDRFLQLAIAGLLIVLVFVISRSFHERVVSVGDSAPGFAITTDSGRKVSVSDFGGRLLVLNFWATWCPPCVQEMPSLDEFQKRLGGSGVVVLGVSVDKDANLYRDFLSRAKVSFLTARDPEAKISSDYGTYKYPETYIIDSKGKVVQKIIGPENWNDERMVSYVKSLL